MHMHGSRVLQHLVATGEQSCHACPLRQVHGSNPRTAGRTPRTRQASDQMHAPLLPIWDLQGHDNFMIKCLDSVWQETGNSWQQLVMTNVSICKVSAVSSPHSLSRSRIVSSTLQWYDYVQSIDGWTACHMSNSHAVFLSRADQRPPLTTSHWYGTAAKLFRSRKQIRSSRFFLLQPVV